MDSQFKIDVLLSTYNGELYLNALLESIINQSFKDWRLLIRDDGSKDSTLEILKDYCKKYPNKIVLISEQDSNLRPMLSFGKLMEFSRSPYVMFCDQDDVWFKEKIELSFNAILGLEEKWSFDKPLLVYTDSFLVDKDLKIISKSTLNYIGLNKPQAVKFSNLILRNVIVGNTIIMNRNLVKLSCPIPKEAFMHDWWVGIVAAAFGHIEYIPKPTIFYRQHDQNVFGLKKISLLGMILNSFKGHDKYYHHQDCIMKQIKVFYERLASFSENREIPKEVLQVAPLANLEKLGYWKRKFFLISFYSKCIYHIKALADLLLYFKIYR